MKGNTESLLSSSGERVDATCVNSVRKPCVLEYQGGWGGGGAEVIHIDFCFVSGQHWLMFQFAIC